MNTSLSNLENLDGIDGFAIPGQTEGDRLGTSVYNAGDINGDGLDDSIVTAVEAGDVNGEPDSYPYSDRRGEAYVIFGTSENSNSTFNLENLNGDNGFKISGIDPNHELGRAVSAGDLNGDGLDDLVLGAPNAGLIVSNYGYSYSESNGEAYIIFGKQDNFAADFDLNSLDGGNGFILKGIDAEDLLGTAVTNAGDLNGDGIDDLAVSAAGGGQLVTNEDGFTSSDRRGEVYVLFGKNSGFEARINLSNLNGNNGFAVEGRDANNSLGSALSNAGDINGDGIDDLLVGTANGGDVLDDPFGNGYSDQRGEVYVIYGKQDGFDDRFNVADLLNGVDGFAISGTGIEDNLGNAVSNAADLNGDGIDDLVLGAVNASTSGEYTREGEVYVIFGGQNNFGTQFDLNSLDGNNGFSLAGIDPGDGLGNAVNLGDFNGDGIDDLFVGASTAGEDIGAFGYSYSDLRGEAYIIFGKDTGFTAQVDLANLSEDQGSKVVGVNSDDLLGSAIASGGDINGDGAEDLIVSAPGVDLGDEYTKEGTTYVIFGSSEVEIDDRPEISGTNEADSIQGGSGNNNISGLNGNDTLNGGGGNDTLGGDQDNDSLSGQSGDDKLIGNQGRDFLDGGEGNDTLDGGNGNDTLAGRNGDDRLSGGNGSDKLLGDDGSDFLDGDSGNDTLGGRNGNDTLEGKNGDDRLLGGDGDDTISGGQGNDTIFGGEGNDILDGVKSDNSEVQLNQRDILVGGAGIDEFILGNENQIYYRDGNPDAEGTTDYASIKDFEPQQDKIQLAGSRDEYELEFFTNAQGRLLANIFYLASGEVRERIAIIDNASSELTLEDPAFIYLATTNIDDRPEIFGTNQADLIEGGVSANQIFGLEGNDTLNGNRGNDTLNGNGGDDLLRGQSGDDLLFGNEESDTLFGGAGDDRLDGGRGKDLLNGEQGEDTLFGGRNADTLSGGDDRDRLQGEGGSDLLFGGTENDLLEGGNGDDTLNGTDPENLELQLGEQDTLVGGRGSDLLILGDANQTYYNDRDPNTEGSADYALIQGFDFQQDTIQLAGNRSEYELTFFTNDQGTVSANIFYLASGEVPEIIGVIENVSSELTLDDPAFDYLEELPPIVPTPEADLLTGTVGDDTISGMDGDDTIIGGDGDDILNGENDNDLLFGDSGNDNVNGGNDNDTLFGASGDDTLNGDNDRDELFGEDGNDLLLGGTENDLLEGGLGNDTLIGTNFGNLELQLGEQDTLIGGGGSDLLILGDSDRMFYNDRDPETEGSTDYALIREFDFSEDSILLQGNRTMYDLTFFTNGSGTTSANLLYLELDATPELVGIIENVSSDLTTANSAFIFV